MMQKYVLSQHRVKHGAVACLTPCPPYIGRTSLPGQIHLSKSAAKHLKSIGMETFVDRRTDGRLVVATYWLTMRCDEDIKSENTNAEAAFDFHK